MEKIKKLTKLFVSLGIVAIAVFDVYVIAKGGTEASISHLLITWSYKYPIFPFSSGVVVGHLFWRVRDTKEILELTDRTKE